MELKTERLSSAQIAEVLKTLKDKGYVCSSYTTKLTCFTQEGFPTVYMENYIDEARAYLKRKKADPENTPVQYFFKNAVYFHPDFLEEIASFPTLTFNPEKEFNSNLRLFPSVIGKGKREEKYGAKATFVDIQSFVRGVEKAIEIFQKDEGVRFIDLKKNRRKVKSLGGVSHDCNKWPVHTNPCDDLETIIAREGKKIKKFTYISERSPKLRRAALEKFGYRCMACGFDFEAIYGHNLGEDFIEVHHIIPVSEDERENNPDNLRPLCANCHRMIHRLYRELQPSEYDNAIDILASKIAQNKP